MNKVLPLSAVMSLLGILAGLAGVNAESQLAVIEGGAPSSKTLPTVDQVEHHLNLFPRSEVIESPANSQPAHLVTERPHSLEHSPIAKDPRHDFSEPCPACGMG